MKIGDMVRHVKTGEIGTFIGDSTYDRARVCFHDVDPSSMPSCCKYLKKHLIVATGERHPGYVMRDRIEEGRK
jgi:hypothetical protein